MSKEAPSTKVKRQWIALPGVRLSYPNLHKARSMEGDDGKAKKPEYSASYILDKKKHAAVIKEIEAETKRLAIAEWGKMPLKFRGPIRDGSTFVDKDDNVKDGYGDDVVAVNAKSQSKQQAVLRDRTPADEDDLYGGCYVNAYISLYTWEHPKSGKGVSANLGPVQFFKNGERFGGAILDADDAFEDLGEDDEGEDEDEDEKPAPKKKAAPAPVKKKKKVVEDDDDYDPTEDL